MDQPGTQGGKDHAGQNNAQKRRQIDKAEAASRQLRTSPAGHDKSRGASDGDGQGAGAGRRYGLLYAQVTPDQKWHGQGPAANAYKRRNTANQPAPNTQQTGDGTGKGTATGKFRCSRS